MLPDDNDGPACGERFGEREAGHPAPALDVALDLFLRTLPIRIPLSYVIFHIGYLQL